MFSENLSPSQVENQLGTYCPDAVLVVLAVDDASSLDQAERILAYLKTVDMLTPDHPCILVANKTDLVRNRVVKSSGWFSANWKDQKIKVSISVGRSVAKKYNIKYIETSPGKYRSTASSILKYLLVSTGVDIFW